MAVSTIAYLWGREAKWLTLTHDAIPALLCRMVAETVAALGGLHIAVNNAGVNKNNAAEDTPEHEWDLTFSVNTKGLFLCCQVPPAVACHKKNRICCGSVPARF